MARDYSLHTNHHNQRSFNGARGRGESEHSGCEHGRHYSNHHSKPVRGGGDGGGVGSEDEEGGGCHLKKTRRRRTGKFYFV